ncbi:MULTISPECIES: hypothetical protein [Nocardiopsis]|uniref:Uncharacterized protein n=1 Tax=Nocardiopsis sinuspersici TaxID=501010 RepID=A0A1V3C657_9ACTN|nr:MULTISPECIES: hypothetical protein [Nocardiopsis]OOC56274.1 hypothetical protein NOSIN_22635 [Nocardiopsis sinuspersici]
MSGVHGLTNASGVRFAVLPAPVRRALLLSALVFGALAGAWLATPDPVSAQEKSAPTAVVHGAEAGAGGQGQGAPAEQVLPEQAGNAARPSAGQADTGRTDTAQTDKPRSDAAQTGTGRPETVRTTAADADRAPSGRADTARTDTSARTNASTNANADTERRVLAAPGRLDKPVTGAVAAMGRKTTRVVFDASAAVTPGLGTGGNGVARQVRDTAPGMPAFVEDRFAADAASDTEPEAEKPSAEGAGPDGDARVGEGDTVLIGSGHATGAVSTELRSTQDTTARYSADRVTESVPAPLTGEAVASSASGTTATGSAPGGATGGGVAGYLPTTGAPAPAPGQLQAAWHVLRSVPAESADEPTFSPD